MTPAPIERAADRLGKLIAEWTDAVPVELIELEMRRLRMLAEQVAKGLAG